MITVGGLAGGCLYSIDSIKVQNDDMQKQHCSGRHCHPMCTCKATAGSAKVERSFQQTSVGQGVLLARKGIGPRTGVVGFAFHGSDCCLLQISCILVVFCRFCVDYLEESITGKDYKNP